MKLIIATCTAAFIGSTAFAGNPLEYTVPDTIPLTSGPDWSGLYIGG